MPDTVGSEAQPRTGTVATDSVSIVGGVPLLDLAYGEDVKAEADINVVCTGNGRFVTATPARPNSRVVSLVKPVAFRRSFTSQQLE